MNLEKQPSKIPRWHELGETFWPITTNQQITFFLAQNTIDHKAHVFMIFHVLDGRRWNGVTDGWPSGLNEHAAQRKWNGNDGDETLLIRKWCTGGLLSGNTLDGETSTKPSDTLYNVDGTDSLPSLCVLSEIRQEEKGSKRPRRKCQLFY